MIIMSCAVCIIGTIRFEILYYDKTGMYALIHGFKDYTIPVISFIFFMYFFLKYKKEI